jgi:transposase
LPAGYRSRGSGAPFQGTPNNEAERALRDAVIARRISNGTRTEEGSAAYAATLSVFETCRRRGVEPWRYITDLLAKARKGLPHLTIPLSA